MAITFVRLTSNSADGSATTLTSTFAANDVGNLAVIGIGYVDGGTISVSTVTDDNSNTWTALTTETRNATQGYSVQLWYARNLVADAGTVTITVTFSAATTFRRIHGAEYHSNNGVFSADPKDQTGTGTGNGTAMATGTITPTLSQEVIVCMGASGSGNVSAGASYTLRSPSGGGVSTGFCDHIQTTISAETAKETASVSGQWCLVAASLFDVPLNIQPAAIQATTTFPSATKSGGATVTPAAISAVATVPAVVVTAGGVNVAPAAISAVTTFPAAAKSAGATVTPAAVLASASFGAAAVTFVTPPPVALIIEAAYGADPDTDLAGVVWTDITEWVRYTSAVSIRAGRHGLGAQTDPLQIRLTLDNRDGRFTPFLNSGANWPDIVRNLPIRVRAATGGGTPIELATAFVDGYELGWDESTNDCVTLVTAIGRLGRLSKKKVVRAAATSTIAATNPVASWPLTDGTSASSAASGLVGGVAMAKTGTLKFGTGVNFTGQPHILDLGELSNTPGKLTGVIPAGTSNTSWRMEVTLNWPNLTPPTDAIGALSWTTEGSIKTWSIDYNKAGDVIKLRYVLADGSGTTSLTSTLTDPYDNTPRRYRVTADQNGTGVDVVLYVDDVAKITQTIGTQTLGRPTKVTVSAGYNFSGGFDGTSMPAVGGLTFWAPYASAVDTTEASSGYVGEMAGDRVTRLCGEAGIPVLVVAGETSAMGIQKDADLLTLLRECEAADHGLLHDNGPDGALVYIPRTARYNALVDMTIDVDLRELQPGFRPVFDGRDSLTAAVVTQPDGSSGSYAKPDAQGDEERSFQANLDDSESLDQHAAWLVAVGTVEGMRYPRVGLNFRRSPELVDIWLADGGIGLRVDVTNLPQQHPPLPVEQFVEGYDMIVSDHSWSVDCDCVPAEPYEVIVLDTSASTLVSAVNASDVTFTSVVSRPPRWTTTDEPVSLKCGGETPIVATTITDVAMTYVSGNTVAHADNASLSPALPASMVAGDLILLFAAIRGTSATVNVPAGYTRLAGWHNMALIGKIHTGSEVAPTVTFAGGAAGDTTSCAMFALRSTVSDINNVTVDWTDYNNPAVSGSVAIPPLTTQKMWDNCTLMYFVAQSSAWTSLATLSGFTEVLDSASALGNDQSVAAGYQIQTTATAVAKTALAITGGASAVSRTLVVAFAPGRSTLTVTRATNGTAISHSAGDALQVANTGNLGLGGGV